jgi:hypothetical protein
MVFVAPPGENPNKRYKIRNSQVICRAAKQTRDNIVTCKGDYRRGMDW